MKVLALPRYDSAGASSRYRMYQFVPALRAAGLEIDVAPLVDREYIDGLYTHGRSRPLQLSLAAIRRLAHVVQARRYDLLWMEKELIPFLPGWVERLLRPSGVPLVVDYDDAIFHRYDQHRSWFIRALLGRKIDEVMASATLVVAGNEYLAERARAAGAQNVVVLPTVIDLDRYPPLPARTHPGLTLGWIGSPSTQRYLRIVAPVLARFCSERGARLNAIGVQGGFRLDGVPLTRIPWTSEGEQRALQEMDVGIMPLTDQPWERGKCGFKLIQYMGCGLPVVASPVGVNREIVVDGVTGLLASSDDDWLAAFRKLADSPDLRRRMGAAGRARVEQHYSLQVVAPRLVEMLRGAAVSARSRRGAPTTC